MTGRRDEYATVQVKLKARTDKAALLENDDGTEGWVPRSCLHFMTDKAVAQAAIGDTIEARIMEWVATKNGLI